MEGLLLEVCPCNAAAPLGLVSQENEENLPKTIKTAFSTSPAKTFKKVSKK